MSTSQNMFTSTRREFLALGSAAAGLAALGLKTGWAQNRAVVDSAQISSAEHQTDVLIIGGGMAGLFAAVKAHDAGARVMMVSKGRLGSSGLTPFAKGFFTFDEATAGMSIDEYVDTVSRSALGTNNPVYTRQTAELSQARAAELREWGFFESNLYHKAFSHPIEARDIPVMERIVITHLIKEGDVIAGAAGFRLDAEEIVTFRAKSVILCTGAGGFKPNGFPVCDLTHDGTVMAYQIGARVTGKEWNDGHSGRAENPAACYDGWGDMFDRVPSTSGVEVHHDLGVDVNYQAYMSGNPVTGGPGAAMGDSFVEGGPYTPEEFARSFPTRGGPNDEGAGQPAGEGRPAGGGPPPGDGPPGNGAPGGPPQEEGDTPSGGAPGPMAGNSMGGASAGMAIHKSEGLVPVDDRCATDIPGLYAAGDALGSHMCGGIYTQIGSSLAGSAVQGGVAGEAAAQFAGSVDLAEISSEHLDQVHEEILAPLKRDAGYGPAWVTQTLQGIMIPNFVLYIKKESLMSAALAYIEELRDHHMPMLRAADMHELRLAHETANMIISAEMKLRASLMRTESRCSHYRLDYPDMDDENWRAWITIARDEHGAMQLEKQAFDAWPDRS